jgi:hypothetical protein
MPSLVMPCEAWFNRSTPGRDRTCDLLFRKQLLYPLSYGGLRSFYPLTISGKKGQQRDGPGFGLRVLSWPHVSLVTFGTSVRNPRRRLHHRLPPFRAYQSRAVPLVSPGFVALRPRHTHTKSSACQGECCSQIMCNPTKSSTLLKRENRFRNAPISHLLCSKLTFAARRHCVRLFLVVPHPRPWPTTITLPPQQSGPHHHAPSSLVNHAFLGDAAIHRFLGPRSG